MISRLSRRLIRVRSGRVFVVRPSIGRRSFAIGRADRLRHDLSATSNVSALVWSNTGTTDAARGEATLTFGTLRSRLRGLRIIRRRQNESPETWMP
jgi:hypothetical protein